MEALFVRTCLQLEELDKNIKAIKREILKDLPPKIISTIGEEELKVTFPPLERDKFFSLFNY